MFDWIISSAEHELTTAQRKHWWDFTNAKLASLTRGFPDVRRSRFLGVFFAKSARKGKVEVAAGPSSCPRSLRSLRRFDGSATCPRPRQLFHHERHLSHRASSSRKLQLKPKVTALSDMYPGRAGMNSAISARSLLNPKIHSLTRASWWIWTSLGEGR